MKSFFTIILCLSGLLVRAQDVMNLFPEIQMLDLSSEGEKAFQEHEKRCAIIWEKLSNGLDIDQLSEAEQNTLKNCDETVGSYWEIIGSGCSWYCAGGPKEVTASSHLDSQGKVDYQATNAHDLDYKTAWVEGDEGFGTGEYLKYIFAANSPRINKIIVANGYVKNETAWRNNSRVKKLKLYLDDQPYAILNLRDQRAGQHFSISPLGNKPSTTDDLSNAPDWTLKFEILEVYPGEKYKDVAISEIYFDGLDVHCLAKGTLITLADSSLQKIESLKPGDRVLSYNTDTRKFEPSVILELARPYHHHLVNLQFSNGDSLLCTEDHPLLAPDGTWYSANPDKTQSDYQFEHVEQLQVGSIINSTTGVLKILSIQKLHENQQTYTLVKLSKNNAFIANGIIVGAETLRETIEY
ncbi:Hint domain-containing protein [Rapidithrix thailandica]|uniref:Hint domain-containing protein n=1 Tax=Rapidithrix thailandica TaxID=413964 RepID=A0AAW9SDZ4_9BACT